MPCVAILTLLPPGAPKTAQSVLVLPLSAISIIFS